VAVFTLVGAGTAQAAARHVAPACATPLRVAPPPGSKLVEDMTYTERNEQDPGNLGYWALDDGFVHVQVWRVAKVSATFGAPYSDFHMEVTAFGRWTTFAGALSPNCQAPDVVREQAGGSGPFFAQFTWDFSGTIIPGMRRFGYLGTIDRGETKADILLNYYVDPVTGDPVQHGDYNPWDPITSYYNSPDSFNDLSTATWYQWWRYRRQVATATVIDNNFGQPIETGDIVITR
jgi:hypothetical protein